MIMQIYASDEDTENWSILLHVMHAQLYFNRQKYNERFGLLFHAVPSPYVDMMDIQEACSVRNNLIAQELFLPPENRFSPNN